MNRFLLLGTIFFAFLTGAAFIVYDATGSFNSWMNTIILLVPTGIFGRQVFIRMK